MLTIKTTEQNQYNLLSRLFVDFEQMKHRIQLINLRPGTLLKKRLQYRCFPIDFVKFLRKPLFAELRSLLLFELTLNCWNW